MADYRLDCEPGHIGVTAPGLVEVTPDVLRKRRRLQLRIANPAYVRGEAGSWTRASTQADEQALRELEARFGL